MPSERATTARLGLSYRRHWRHWLPRALAVDAITLDRHVYFAAPKSLVDRSLVDEEERHVEQWAALGKRWFVFLYVAQYLLLRLKGLSHEQAYRRISFEKQAKGGDRDDG